MDTEPQSTSFLTPAAVGIIVPNVLAAISLGVLVLVGREPNTDIGTIGTTAFIVIPLVMGFISAYFWQHLDWSYWKYTGYSGINALIVLALAAAIASEGVVCLVILSPLMFLELLIGAFVGKAVFKRRSTPLSSSVLGVLVLLVLFDLSSSHEYRAEVSDQIVIHASLNQVWRYVDATPRNDSPAEFWMFNIGLPRPIQTTVAAHQQGAKRACVFSSGVTFDEVMTVYEPNRNLTFDIVSQPADPEIIGHITMERGQFLLHDNGNGTTTLTGTSWYRLHVFPAAYFNLWAEAITRNVHLHAMKHIKELAEKRY